MIPNSGPSDPSILTCYFNFNGTRLRPVNIVLSWLSWGTYSLIVANWWGLQNTPLKILELKPAWCPGPCARIGEDCRQKLLFNLIGFCTCIRPLRGLIGFEWQDSATMIDLFSVHTSAMLLLRNHLRWKSWPRTCNKFASWQKCWLCGHSIKLYLLCLPWPLAWSSVVVWCFCKSLRLLVRRMNCWWTAISIHVDHDLPETTETIFSVVNWGVRSVKIPR